MFKKQDLTNKIYIGVVENVYDETRKGRIQVRVQTVFNDIPLEHIPWAEPQRSLDGRTFSVPAIGKIVNVIFVNGNIYEPQYIFSENYNNNLQQKLNDMTDEEYENFAALLMDHRTQIYSDDENLRLDYKFNQLSIHNDGINVHLKDNNQELHVGHNNADQSAMLGDHFLEWMDSFMQTLLTPTSLVGNNGAPILKPQLDAEIMKYQALRQTFISQHVKVVDNGMCMDIGENRKNSPAMDDLTELNGEKILNSKLIDDTVKKSMKEKRDRDKKTSDNSKPDPNDDSFSEKRMEDYNNAVKVNGEKDSPDTSKEEIIISDEDKKIYESLLTPKQKASIQNTEDVEKRKNQPKTEITDDKNNVDPYDQLWVGYKGRSKESYEIEKHKNINYGSYTSDSNVVEGAQMPKYKGTAKKRKTKDGKEVINGKLENDDLVAVEGFHRNGKPSIIYLERNAAVAWKKLNDAFIEEFNKPISINGNGQDYRTYETQLNYWNQYKNGGNLAARPGTSNHGWGVACDINYHGKGVLAWLEANASKYKIYKRVPSENWHWVYTGPTIYA